MRRTVLLLTIALATGNVADCQVFDEQFEHWPIDLKINGQILIAGTLEDPGVLKNLVRSDPDGRVVLFFDDETPIDVVQKYTEVFEESDTDRDEERDSTKETEPEPANDSNDDETDSDESQPEVPGRTIEFVSGNAISDIGECISGCKTFVWYASKPVSAEVLTELAGQRTALQDHVASGGTLIVVGSVAETLAQYFSLDDDDNPSDVDGLNLLPDCIVETGFRNSAHGQSRILSLVAAHPRSVGIGLEDNTVLVLSGRKVQVVGQGTATCMLMANERQPIRIQTISSERRRRGSPNASLIDLTEWRRDAIDRTLPVFPPAEPPVPHVENGTLVIVGGGGMPEGMMARIVDLAGGPDAARMVYIPCAEDDEVSDRQSTVEAWKRMGVKHATFIHTKDRHTANSDEEFLAPLRDATGLWFGGGRQWNFSDSYYGTKAHELMKGVLQRGGVIGGSSAGASIQGRYLARATPIGNFDIMAPGYERGGLGFLGGVAIDQHFSQRGRQKDMTQLVNRYPQMLGIGLDEATAIVVQHSVADIVGRGKVFFYNRRLPVYPDRPDYVALPAGSSYDLAAREVLKDTTETIEDDAENDTATSDDE
jgi:cyanophycinase